MTSPLGGAFLIPRPTAGEPHCWGGPAIDLVDETEVIPNGRRVLVAHRGLGSLGELPHLRLEQAIHTLVDIRSNGGITLGEHGDERILLSEANFVRAGAMSPLEAALLTISQDLTTMLRMAQQLQQEQGHGRTLETVSRTPVADMAEVRKACGLRTYRCEPKN